MKTEEPELSTRSFSLNLTRPLAVLDFETTGTAPAFDRIVEIGILKIFPEGSRTVYHRRVNPQCPIPPEATSVHGIGDDEVKQCPSFEKIAPELLQFLEECDLAGFNLLNFDLPLLQKEFARANVEFSRYKHRVVDACKIFHRKEPRNLISALKFFCNEDHSQSHSALHDVEACWRILEAQLTRYADLPRDMDGLDNFCSEQDGRFVDADRKFEWRYNEATIAFGKNRGRSLKEIVRQDPGFLQWILASDFGSETKDIVRKALEGKFPRQSAYSPKVSR
jgi:DNA polymerase-3 subunit epsilon